LPYDRLESAFGVSLVSRYAAKTTVSVERSRAEIETTLTRYGAEQFMYGWDQGGALIAFVVRTDSGQRRQVRFQLPLPSRDLREFTHHSRGARTATESERLWEQACRQRWRALLLVVKAKLEAVETGIATFEDEFLAYIMLPDGRTVGGWVGPQLEAAYDPDRGIMPSGLPLLEIESGESE
jgi:hypothetical protein